MRIGGDDFVLQQRAVTASVGRRFDRTTTVTLAAGAVVGGEIAGDAGSPFVGREWNVEPGWLVSVTGARRWFGEGSRVPFLTTTLSYGMSFAATAEVGEQRQRGRERLSASDLRLGVLVGLTLWDTWSPYLAARAFAGPIRWRLGGEDVTGSDRHHYAVGLGSSVALSAGAQLSFDGSIAGERSLSAGVSVTP